MIKNSEFCNIQRLVYQERNFDEAIDLLLNSDYITTQDFQRLLAQVYFFKFDFEKAAIVFNNLKDSYNTGFCKLLQGNSNEALNIWKNTAPSPAQNWGMFFCELFTEKVTTKPSYLQVRAFLERDLNLFLKVNLPLYVQKIIDISEFLAELNPETNKIIARTFLYNDYTDYAKEYFERALDYTEEDAELYYLLGLYYQKTQDISSARISLNKAVKLNDNYIPAKNLLSKL